MKRTFRFELGENRFHRPVWQIAAFLAALQKAEFPQESDDNSGILLSASLPFSLIINLNGIREGLLAKRFAKYLEFVEYDRPESGKKPMYWDHGLNEMRHTFLASVFALAAEPYLKWFAHHGNHGKPKTKLSDWPPLLAFAKLTRNAICHSGSIGLTDKADVVGKWRDIVIDRSVNDHLIGEYISCAEIIVLFYDLNQELDAVGAPSDLYWQKIEPINETGTAYSLAEPAPFQKRRT